VLHKLARLFTMYPSTVFICMIFCCLVSVQSDQNAIVDPSEGE